jgi:hypothetical protein
MTALCLDVPFLSRQWYIYAAIYWWNLLWAIIGPHCRLTLHTFPVYISQNSHVVNLGNMFP